MNAVLAADQPTGVGRLTARDVLRYSAIYAVFVVPASFIALGLPATVLAAWIIGRRIARRFQRQLLAREALHLALASWAWAFAAFVVRNLIGAQPFALVALGLIWQAVAFATTWAVYVWFTPWVIRRQLGEGASVETRTVQEPHVRSATGMLARQKEQYAQATARGVTLAVAWLTVGAIGLPAIFVLSALIALPLGLLGLPTGPTMYAIMAVLGMPALLGGWVWFVSHKSAEVFPSHRMVLWLRRFHQTDLREFPFASFLERASRGIAVPVTLQDTTVAEARTAASLRPEYYVLQAAMLACMIGTMLSLVGAFTLESAVGRRVAGTLAVLAIAGVLAIPFAMKRLGVLRVGTRRGDRQATRLLDAIDSAQGVPQTLTVLSVPDAAWQTWVLELLKRADAVLVDVTHLSPNLHWELRTIAAQLDPQQLILAFGSPTDAATDLAPDTRTELAGIMGEEMVDRSQRFGYALPRRSPLRRLLTYSRRRNGWLEVSKADTRRYGPVLADTLNNAFTASDRAMLAANEDPGADTPAPSPA